MTLIEMINTMKHYESGGEVEFKNKVRGGWFVDASPSWNWSTYDYRIKPKPVELLYEWWYTTPNSPRVFLGVSLYTKEEAESQFMRVDRYGKTGRWFNPETKEFGGGK